LLARGESLSTAAKDAHLSEERLRRFVIENNIATKRGNRIGLKRDIARRLLIFSEGREHTIVVTTARAASLVGRYMAAVRWFLETNEIDHLEPFIGMSVRDANGESYPFETRPNVLYRLSSTGSDGFEQVYRIVV
jgi:hypothetical protein